MKLSALAVSLAAFSLLAISAPLCAKQQELPEVTEDGLHRVPDSKLAVVYAEPGADLSGYEKVQLLEAYVAFKKNWARDQRSRSAQPLSLSSKDIERMKTGLSEEFQIEFTKVLEDGGYPVVDQAGPEVLLIRPAIINLDVTAPDTMAAGRSRVYTDSAGEMTLYVEIYDSVTGDLIAKAMDRRMDGRNNGFYTWTNSATNKQAAVRILRGWANILLDALNEAKQQAVAADSLPEADS
jgi:hypothetical protein